MQSLRTAHRSVAQQWNARVLELERRVNELTSENAQLRAQLTAAPPLDTVESAPSTLDAFDRAVALAAVAAPVQAVAAAAIVVVGDASAPVFVAPTPPSAKGRRRPRGAAVVDVVDLSDDGSPPVAVSKRARSGVSVAAVDDGDDDDGFQLLSQLQAPASPRAAVVVRPLNLQAAAAAASGKEDALQNQPTAAAGAPSKPFRYIEPVLNRAERRRLVGRECEQCAEFYTAVCAATGREPEREAFVQAHSRHREICTPPPRTPDGFWNVDFDAADVRSDATTQ